MHVTGFNELITGGRLRSPRSRTGSPTRGTAGPGAAARGRAHQRELVRCGRVTGSDLFPVRRARLPVDVCGIDRGSQSPPTSARRGTPTSAGSATKPQDRLHATIFAGGSTCTPPAGPRWGCRC
ncbi:hypothetical protein HBB16_21200 [Pseudonocardia sp. MCCB 268]|nr:hypothetical protein [Pseudonocardia cytotoxica]